MPGLDRWRRPLAPKENSPKACIPSVAPWNSPFIFFLYLFIRAILDLGASLPSRSWSNEPYGTSQDPRNGFVRLYTNLIFCLSADGVRLDTQTLYPGVIALFLIFVFLLWISGLFRLTGTMRKTECKGNLYYQPESACSAAHQAWCE